VRYDVFALCCVSFAGVAPLLLPVPRREYRLTFNTDKMEKPDEGKTFLLELDTYTLCWNSDFEVDKVLSCVLCALCFVLCAGYCGLCVCCGLCAVCCAVCCVLCVCCVLRDVCFVLCVLCAVCCVLCAVFVLCAV
jgi:hypothetical protein